MANTGIGSQALEWHSRRTVANEQQMDVEAGGQDRQQFDDAIEPVPRANETGEAEDKLAVEAETFLRRLTGRQRGEPRRVDAVGNDDDALVGNALTPQIVGEHRAYRQCEIGAPPGHPLRPRREATQRQPVLRRAFLAKRGVDLQQQGDAVECPQQRAGEREEIVALVDRIGPLPANRRQ